VIMPYLKLGHVWPVEREAIAAPIQVLGIHTGGGMQEQITVPVDILFVPPHLDNETDWAIVGTFGYRAIAIRRAQLGFRGNGSGRGLWPIRYRDHGNLPDRRGQGPISPGHETRTRLQYARKDWGGPYC